jgi:membrane protein DedA with SNARE-associated domain
MIHEFLQQSVVWVVGLVGDWGYTGIVIMMFLESSCFPFPSEVVMIPAGYLSSPAYLSSPSYIPGHEMNFWLAIVAGIIGSWLGALFNYYLALWLGRPLLLKWGKYFFISEKNFDKGEAFFKSHGEISTFTARLIPIARMNMFRFLLWTGLGAGIWVAILTAIGYVAGQNSKLIEEYSKSATLWALAGVAVITAAYIIIHRRRKSSASKP